MSSKLALECQVNHIANINAAARALALAYKCLCTALQKYAANFLGVQLLLLTAEFQLGHELVVINNKSYYHPYSLIRVQLRANKTKNFDCVPASL